VSEELQQDAADTLWEGDGGCGSLKKRSHALLSGKMPPKCSLR